MVCNGILAAKLARYKFRLLAKELADAYVKIYVQCPSGNQEQVVTLKDQYWDQYHLISSSNT